MFEECDLRCGRVTLDLLVVCKEGAVKIAL